MRKCEEKRKKILRKEGRKKYIKKHPKIEEVKIGIGKHTNPFMNFARKRIKHIFDIRRNKGTLSKAHDFDYVEAVAKNAYNYTIKKTGDIKLTELAYIAGIFHDIKREKNEKKSHAALWARWILTSKEGKLIRSAYGHNALEQVAFAIALHSMPFNKPCIAIVGESIVKWYIKNPLHKYPKENQEKVIPLFYWEQLYVSDAFINSLPGKTKELMLAIRKQMG